MHFKKWSGFLAHPVVNIIIATLGLLINIVNVNWDKKITLSLHLSITML